MAAIAIQNSSRDGVDVAGAAASGGGDTFVNTGAEELVIKNGGGSSITVTVATPKTVDGLAVADKTITVGAGVTKVCGPWPPDVYNSDGLPGSTVGVTYSGVTSVTVAVIKRV